MACYKTYKKNEVNDNTKPSVKMGRKAYRVSKRQPGCRNAKVVSAPVFFVHKPNVLLVT